MSLSRGRKTPWPSGVMLKLFGSSTTTMGVRVPLVRANFPSAFAWYSEITGCTVWASTQLPSSSHAKQSDPRNGKTFPSLFAQPHSKETCDVGKREAVPAVKLDPVARHAIVAHSPERDYRACACMLSVPV